MTAITRPSRRGGTGKVRVEAEDVTEALVIAITRENPNTEIRKRGGEVTE
jgi:hypothetical protein